MKKLKTSSILQIAVSILVAIAAAVIYIGQLNNAVTNNTLVTISELAQHDKRSIEAFIQTSWDELDGIAKRFVSYDCKTILEIETRMNLECSTSDFSHIYLLAQDGKVYTDKYLVYDPAKNTMDRQVNLLPFFENGQKHIVTRWDDKAASSGMSREYVLYGTRLDNFTVDGIKMLGLVALSDTSSIQKHIILNSFLKDGVRRGYSAIISNTGDYIIGTQKTFYFNVDDNLYSVLETGSRVELSKQEIDRHIQNKETFRFHYTDESGVRKLLYLTPFEKNIDWYFITAVENEVFIEQSRQFTVISLTMLLVIMLVAILLMLALNASHNKTVEAVAQARAQGEFLSNMSHEIRTPLNGLIGLNHLVMTHIDEEDQAGQIKDWLRKSHSTANYLLSLVNDILDISKLQAGEADIDNEPVLIETLIDAIWSMQRDNVEGRGVRFIIEQDIPFPCIVGDSTRLKQVLMNIVGNAAKFTPKGGSITLSVRQEELEEGRIKTIFRCQDTGVGMSQEFIDRIFDAFSQERNKNSDSVKGTGLGMAISKLLVDAMGGEIQVESVIDAGTTFTVSLPAEVVQEELAYAGQSTDIAPAEEGEAAASTETDTPTKVLVVEDNELNAEILLDILEAEGFEVEHAENGRIAVDKFAESEVGEFHIVLMDMQMPVLDGCSACVEIRGLDRPDAKTVSIFACTANTFKEDRDRAINSGMNDFLTKPIDVDVLLQKLRRGGGSTDVPA